MKSTLLSWKTTHGTWFHFRKEGSLFDADGFIEQRLLQMVRSESKKLNLLQEDTHRYVA